MSSELVWIHRFNANELGLSKDDTGTGRGSFFLVPKIARKLISPTEQLDINVNVTFLDLHVTISANYTEGYPNDLNKNETRLYVKDLSDYIGLESNNPINPEKIGCFYRKNEEIFVILDSRDSVLDKLLIAFPYRGKPNNVVTNFVFNDNETDRFSAEGIGENILFYGVAGVGKSHNVKEYIKKRTGYNENNIERIVFHPDYLNTDFVGQILPTVNTEGKIDYQFKAGSFTKILKKAFENPDKHFYLVIEEINRGNAPAIFGEVFQLLDRKADGSSTYRISHDLMIDDINKSDKITEKLSSIYIPSNLTILATMNTADQNVFTLDTAFQRRWTMRMIENNIEDCGYKNVPVLDTGVSWQQFNTVINEHILEVNKDTLSSEDKRLGAFFVRADELKLPDDLNNGIPFAEKVIKYLWDDVFKFNKSALFQSHLNSLDKVLRLFRNNHGFNRFEIFNEDIKAKLQQGKLPAPQVSDNSNEA